MVEELGLGAGFSRWVRLLLSDTKGAALVRGCLATPRRFEAGVRQGCPLSPYLYLLIGQALLCWLKERGIGMDLGDGIFVVASQYADDTAAPLECGAPGVAAFLAAMRGLLTHRGSTSSRPKPNCCLSARCVRSARRWRGCRWWRRPRRSASVSPLFRAR